MIKYLLRKTIYKEYDKDSQDKLLQLNLKYHTVVLLCWMFWAINFIVPLIPLFIIDACEDFEFSMTTQIILIGFILLCSVGFIIFSLVFFKAMCGFSLLLAEKIYFLVCTTKGNALRRKDFKIIKNSNESLYSFIATQECRGYCYSICFAICKALKRGYIEFLAVNSFSTNSSKDNDGKFFTMHVIYVSNGWAFDTYSCLQYPIEKIYEIYEAKIYKSFSFDEISSKSYKEFAKDQWPELKKWCDDNDCSAFLKAENLNT